MAGQYLSLLEIKAAVTFRGDLEGLTDRHPDLNIEQEINLSYRQLRVKLANNDVMMVLQPTAVLTLPIVETVAGGGYAEIDWPTDAVSIHGIDAKVNGCWNPIPQGFFTQRRMGGYDQGDCRFGDPVYSMWIVRSLPTTSGSSAVAGKIMLFPVPQGGQYVIWYLPEWVDLVTDTNLFPGQESWIQWVIWDVVCKCLVRDIGPQASAQLQEAEKARALCWTDIKTNTQRIAGDGPIQPQSRYGSQRGRHRMVP
jgi:hypothetical protein